MKEKSYIVRDVTEVLSDLLHKAETHDAYLLEQLKNLPQGHIRSINRRGEIKKIFNFQSDGVKHEKTLAAEDAAILTKLLNERLRTADAARFNAQWIKNLKGAASNLHISIPGASKINVERKFADLSAVNANSKLHTKESIQAYRSRALAGEKVWCKELPINHEQLNQPVYPEKLLFRTRRGEMVRSKSEMMIADALYAYGLDYEYELPLTWNNINLRPDFIIWHPIKKIIIIWEHLGKMNDDGYLQRNMRKLETYQSMGYFAGDNLILTMESNNKGLHSLIIDSTMHCSFM